MATCRDLRAALEALAAQARKNNQRVGEQTLAAAIEARQQQLFLNQQAEIQRLAAKDREAATERLAEVEQVKARAQAAEHAREAARIAARAEDDRLLAAARDPTMQQKYSQFLGPGRYNLSPIANNETRGATFRDIDQPLSLSQMQNHLLHQDTKRFGAFAAKRTISLSGNTQQPSGLFYKELQGTWLDYENNDRGGRWAWPDRDTAMWQEVAKRQAEFFQLAPYWVRLKLLQP